MNRTVSLEMGDIKILRDDEKAAQRDSLGGAQKIWTVTAYYLGSDWEMSLLMDIFQVCLENVSWSDKNQARPGKCLKNAQGTWILSTTADRYTIGLIPDSSYCKI